MARMLGGHRYPANSGGRVDVESDQYVAQVKLVKTLSLAHLEELCGEMTALGHEQGKLGRVTVKRRAGRGIHTERLICMTEGVWKKLWERKEKP